MKRSDKMGKLLKINRLQESAAAASFASASDRHQQLQDQLTRLESYWDEYSVQLETLKKTTSSAAKLQEHQDFLAKLNEAITQMKSELANSQGVVDSTQETLRDRNIDVEKIKKATASIRDEEQTLERRIAQKAYDDQFSGKR